MIRIGNPLSETEFIKVREFLTKIKPLLATNECTFQMSGKNKDFDRQFSLRDDEKIIIIKSLTPEDCVKVEPNNNSRYADADVYVFIRCVEIVVFGEKEPHKLYIKIYLREKNI